MACDVHAHPYDILRIYPDAEAERRSLGIACAASSCTREEFLFHEKLAITAKQDGAPALFLCFAVHPQLPASAAEGRTKTPKSANDFLDKLTLLSDLAAEGRISAVGETGFDLYSERFRATEKIQDELFTAHLEIARRHDLPLILHVRRAMHKIFPYAKILKTLPAVVFHSSPCAPGEGFALLRKGIGAFFSFGTTLLLNHKNAISSCAEFPAEHLLLETDAPYQPLRGKDFSCWADLPVILKAAAAIRKEAAAKQGTDAAELEEIIDRNFFEVF